MKNFFWIFGILAFIITTAIVMNENDSYKIKRVVFTNENFIVRNTSTKFDSKTIHVDNSTISYETSNKKINPSTITEDKLINQKHDVVNNWSETNYTKTSSKNYDYSTTAPQKPQTLPPQNNRKNERERFYYRDIDWNTWKSNFVNQILEDSVAIETLDDYGIGSGFYYSFIVTNTGEIRDINVVSMQLTAKDKARVKKLIKSYAHKSITKFPKNTDRKTAKVSAIMMLGEQEKRSNPSDFNENERIKVRY